MNLDPSPAKTKPIRRRFTISLRTLMILVLIVGGGIGWKANRASKQRKAVATLKKSRMRMLYDYEFENGLKIPNGKPWAPKWLRNHVGDEYFQEITSVEFFSIKGKEVKESDLAGVEGLDRLESFCLHRFGQTDEIPNGIEVTDAVLGVLERSPRLRILKIANTRVTDAGLAKLSRMSALEELDIRHTRVTAAGLVHLQGLKNLKKLALNTKSSTDEGLAQVAKFPQLQELIIDGPCTMTDKGLEELQRLPDLRSLEIYRATLTDESLARIKHLNSLRELKLTAPLITKGEISDAGFAHIAEMSELVSLELTIHLPPLGLRLFSLSPIESPITKNALAPFGKLTKLRKLALQCNFIDDDALSHLERLTDLRELHMNALPITDDGLAHIERLTQLEKLWIVGGGISDAGLTHFHKLTNLQHVFLMTNGVSETGLTELRAALPSTEVNSVKGKPPSRSQSENQRRTGQGQSLALVARQLIAKPLKDRPLKEIPDLRHPSPSLVFSRACSGSRAPMESSRSELTNSANSPPNSIHHLPLSEHAP